VSKNLDTAHDFEMNGMEMTNHKWVVESEIEPTQ